MDFSKIAAEVCKNICNNPESAMQFTRDVIVRSRSEKIESFLKQLTTNHENTKTVIKEIVVYHTESKTNQTVFREVTFFIIELFSSVIIKKNLKKYLHDLLTEYHLTNEIIKEAADCIFKKAAHENICDLKECLEFLNFTGIMQTSPTYDLEENIKPLVPLYTVLYRGFVQYAKWLESLEPPDDGIAELFEMMHEVLKQLLSIFTKDSLANKLKKQYINKLMTYSYLLLDNAKTPFELRSTICLFFLFSYRVSQGTQLSMAQLINGERSPFSISLENSEAPKDFDIVLYCSILDLLPEEKLITERIGGKPVICSLFEGILENSEMLTIRNLEDEKVITSVSRKLCQATKHLKGVAIDLIPPLLKEGFRYVLLHADRCTDMVKTVIKMFFAELVGLAAYHFHKGVTELTTFMMNLINHIPDQCNMNFWTYELIAKYYGPEFLLEKFDELPIRLLKMFLENPNLRLQISKTYRFLVETCYTTASKEAELEWAETWVLPAGTIMRAKIDGEMSEFFCNSILGSAFNLQPAVLRMIYPNDFIGTEGDGKLLLTCLNEARKHGIELSYQEKDSKFYWRGLIDKQKMEMYMIHQNSQIRLLVLAAVANSLKSTELFSDWELIYLMNYIKFNITVEGPSDRKILIGFYKKILVRFDAGIKVIERNIANVTKYITMFGKNNTPQSKKSKTVLVFYSELKKKYRRFIDNLMKFLIGNLSSDSNFPRRNNSLELLLVICNIIPHQEWITYWTADDVKNSHNILFDTYESNKRMIVTLFKTLPPEYLGFMNTGFTFRYMQRSIALSLDVKPSKTMSAAYLLELCSCSPHFYEIVRGDRTDNDEMHEPTLEMIDLLTKKFLIESTNIKVENIGVTKTAVYGLILSIRHLLEKSDIQQHHQRYAQVFNDLAPACINISETLLPIVCNPSPEGYLPDNVEDIGVHDDTPNAQIVLVYAWRTIKEITLLLAELLKQSVRLESFQITLLPTASLIEIAQLFIDIFLQSKHRGVFEQAYVGFSIVCESFWKSTNKEIANLPKKWLRDAVDLCIGKKHSDDLCSTRRSAGLPFLILSVLTTDGAPYNFRNTIDDLLKSAEDSDKSSDETRTHCLNVLRAIFRDSKMSERALPYVAAGVILAISGFKSPIWGIRNSSTLLFAALMTRMFGVQRSSDSDNMSIKNKLTVQVFFMRHQQLYKFMLNSLAEECNNKSSLILQPILMILSRLYPSSFEERPETVSDLLPHIEVCLKNPVYRIREAAANASVALIRVEDIKTYFDKCFDRIANRKIADNECHGILLQMKSILNKIKVTDLPLSRYIEQSCYIWESEERHFSHMTINLYTELVTTFLYQLKQFDDVYWLKQILLYLSKTMTNQPRVASPFTSQENFGRTRLLLAYLIMINKVEETDSTYSTIAIEIMAILYAPHCRLKETCLQFLICLNQVYEYNNEMDMSICALPWPRYSHLKLGEEHKPDIEGHPLFRMGYVQIDSEIRKLVYSFRHSSIKKLLKYTHSYVKSFLAQELKRPHYIREDDRVLLFLLAAYYPCAIKMLKLNRQETLNTLVNFCNCDNEEMISAVISCISSYLSELDYILYYGYDELLKVLTNSASPAAAVHRRLAVCEFLCDNYFLYCNRDAILKSDQLCTILNIVMVLLEDDNVNIREGMSKFEYNIRVRIKISESVDDTIPGFEWPVSPEKAREDLVNLMTVFLPQEQAVCQIFSWACRYFPDYYAESCEIFERGGLNQFAENTPLVDLCSKVLIKILWKLPDGLSYDDRSIFLEEQTLIVTVTLLNSLLRYDSPMMLPKTKMTVLCALRMLYDFLDETEIGTNFVENFKTYFNETTLSYLTKTLQLGDHFCVTKLFKQLYDPLFRQRR
ncbi:uncharacterized protein LOC109543125 isoform X1 [Dendroctonus ponderosae]|uniref:uncharacterized protein LOC109543125 isoform X1 n=1 Tax=Dendroctonus ponderosae TaxID=77166 RepID=UPI0020362968|nr:uncharacterized protein LOC109543125 isoform X1 [Dendroctonus ponderosae]